MSQTVPEQDDDITETSEVLPHLPQEISFKVGNYISMYSNTF